MNIFQQVVSFIDKHNLIQDNKKIVIGLSGGPDSVFLLHFLVFLQTQKNVTLIAAHLNHEWRPESYDEEILCKNITAALHIPFISAKISDLPHCVKYNGSKEEYARKIRRYFLEKIKQDHSANYIALGHHLQDQQENFFIRLIRGTSLSGLTGMMPCNKEYIRPLLEISKEDILTWLHTHNISYAYDASNNSDKFLRNRLRTNVIQSLRTCDKRFDMNFLATIEKLTHAEKLLQTITHESFQKISYQENNKNILNLILFFTLDCLLYHRIITHWLITENVPFQQTESFLNEIIRFLHNTQGGTHLIHPQWSIVKKQNKAYITSFQKI